MLGYVFTSIDDAVKALARVNTHAGYPRVNDMDVISSGKPFTTDTYCDILPRPDGLAWAILQDYITDAALPDLAAEELDETWWTA